MLEDKKLNLRILILCLLIFSLLTGCQIGQTTYAAQLNPTYTPQTVLVTPNPEATKRAYASPLTQTPTSGSPLFPTATLASTQVVNTPNTKNNQNPGSSNQNARVPLIQQPESPRLVRYFTRALSRPNQFCPIPGWFYPDG
jgi:hypothetical protein